MIASFEHNYIFIKIGKAAGTSVEMALSRFCGPRDIITPIYPRDEIERKPPARHAQNFSNEPVLERRFAERADAGDLKALWSLFDELDRKSNFHHHMPAVTIRSKIGDRFWQNAFKFAIDRNPYERVVSHAIWSIYMRSRSAVDDPAIVTKAIDASIDRLRPSEVFYSIDGAIAVDKVLRYENLVADLATIAGRVGGDVSVVLPRAKGGVRKPHHSAANLLSGDQKRRIAERFASTFALLGYSTEI